jgi:hypothetical protein
MGEATRKKKYCFKYFIRKYHLCYRQWTNKQNRTEAREQYFISNWWGGKEHAQLIICNRRTNCLLTLHVRGRRGRDCMVVGFTYAVSDYHHWCCEFEYRSGRGVQHYVIKYDFYKVVGSQDLNYHYRHSWSLSWLPWHTMVGWFDGVSIQQFSAILRREQVIFIEMMMKSDLY